MSKTLLIERIILNNIMLMKWSPRSSAPRLLITLPSNCAVQRTTQWPPTGGRGREALAHKSSLHAQGPETVTVSRRATAPEKNMKQAYSILETRGNVSWFCSEGLSGKNIYVYNKFFNSLL